MIIFISSVIAFYVVTLFIFIQMMVTSTPSELFIPKEMADSNCVDMVTTTILVIINHIAFLPEVICYWIYKLCLFFMKKR